jgi:hypothetical protein
VALGKGYSNRVIYFKITDTTKFESELDEILEFKQGDIVKCREKDGDFYAFELFIKNVPYK